MRQLPIAVPVLVFLSTLPASAQRLPATVVPEHYDLAFVVDLAHARFEGTETIRVRVPAPTARIVLHAVDIEFHDVTIGAGAAAQKASVTMDDKSQTATLTVPRPLETGTVDVHVRYAAALNDSLRGFYLSKDRNRSYAVTQFESTDARRAFPSFDEPVYKATFDVTLTIDRGDTAISNGRVVSDAPGPTPTQHTIRFATTPRMSTYLVAMVVGNFQCVEGAAENVPIRICATADKKELGRIALESAQQILRFYNSYFAITYPYGKLDVVAVPDFAAGAMENTAAIFYRETDLLADSKTASVHARKDIASVLAHEMAHQWFGDLVTMQWWDDIWLNEGFATWMANKPLADAHADWNIAVDEQEENQTALSLDALKSTRPIHADVETPAQIDEAFDVIAYQKGAAVLRMIENYVGPETFRSAINAYLKAHAYENATSEDFWKAVAGASGKPIDRVLPTFVNQPGAPLVDVSAACANNRTTVTLKQQRMIASGLSADARAARPDGAGGSGERWQVPVCVRAAGSTTPSCELLTDISRTFTLPALGCAPWIFANAAGRGYYRTAYAPELLRAMAPHVETDLTAPERYSLVGDEWAMVRAGRHDAGDYLSLVSGFGREHTSGVLREITGRLAFIHEYLTTAASAPRLESMTRSLLQPLATEVGMSVRASDSDDRRALRMVVVAALGTFGNDPEVAAQARAALDRSLAGGAPLDGTLASAITTVAAQHGDARLFDALASASARAASPEDQYRDLYALTEFRDPALVDRALARTLSPEMRSQDASLYLSRFFANPAARPRAWSFVKSHWTDLQPKLAVFGGDVGLVHALGAFCDAQSRSDIVAFLDAHTLPGAERTLAQSLEQIDGCIALRERQTPAVARWLQP